MSKIEILSPVGSPESVFPAVRMGADALYLGLKNFSARNKAENFSEAELAKTIKYCHAVGVKVYIAMNTLIKDEEIPSAIELADTAVRLCVDAFIIQDMGLFSLLKQKYPQMTFHASTQTSVCNEYGARFLYKEGFKRVVLPRELSKKEINKIIKACPIETEVFVHGALCVCVSGQCYMSAMLGTRSANRGICAGSCRLPFKINGVKNDYALSLKDNSIIDHLTELEEMGVTSAKIEGRMKRPEYTAQATKACREALSGDVSKETRECLQAVFSRDGFTDGYYTGRITEDMYGKREKKDVISATNKVLASIRGEYRREAKRVAVDFVLEIGADTIILTVEDKDKNRVKKQCKIDTVGGFATDGEAIKKQLHKTGNTIFYVRNCKVIGDTVSGFKLSLINGLRREVLEELFEVRSIRIPTVCNKNFTLSNYGDKSEKDQKSLAVRVWLEDINNIPKGIKNCEYIYVPFNSDIRKLEKLKKTGYNIAVRLPRFIPDGNIALKKLKQYSEIGINDAWGANIDAIEIIKEVGLNIHGGFGLNIFNRETLAFFKEQGLKSVELSPELTFNQVDNLSKADISIKKGIITYGRLPLMLLRSCPAKFGKYGCGKTGKRCKGMYLKDRLGEKFYISCRGDHVEILNGIPLNVCDKEESFKHVDFAVLILNVENSVEKFENYALFNNLGQEKGRKTSGLYVRGVE